MIDIRKLKELVRLMVSNDLTEIDLRDDEEQVTLRRQNATHQPQLVSAATQIPQAAPAQSPPPAPQPPADAGSSAAPTDDTDSDLVEIQSPMVGTFYNAPNPDSEQFVKVGDHVNDDTIVCLVEAMKIFNEIKAETSGTIEKILVKNAESVEFGQALFLVRPD